MTVNIEQSSVISQVAFKATIGIFFGLAILSIIGRLGYRIHARRNLYPDDYIVLFGTLCLCAAIGILYEVCDVIFLSDVLVINPSLFVKASPEQIKLLLETPHAIDHAFFALTWTTVFAVKLSFLIFFKKLINRVTKIHIYYWIVGIITCLSWLFSILEPLILCKHPYESIAKCSGSSQRQVFRSMAWLVNSLDIFTDFLIVSIPLIVLRRARIKQRQKLALIFFLCLSIAMIVIAIVRVTRFSHDGGIDVVWQILWQTLESCVALLMISITAFRSIFVSQRNRNQNRKQWAAPSYPWIQRVRQRKASEEDGVGNISQQKQQQLPSIPQATFTKKKEYFQGRHHHQHHHPGARTEGNTTLSHETETGFSDQSKREREDESSLIMKNSREEISQLM